MKVQFIPTFSKNVFLLVKNNFLKQFFQNPKEYVGVQCLSNYVYLH